MITDKTWLLHLHVCVTQMSFICVTLRAAMKNGHQATWAVRQELSGESDMCQTSDWTQPAVTYIVSKGEMLPDPPPIFRNDLYQIVLHKCIMRLSVIRFVVNVIIAVLSFPHTRCLPTYGIRCEIFKWEWELDGCDLFRSGTLWSGQC